jgi:hypothetical protein
MRSWRCWWGPLVVAATTLAAIGPALSQESTAGIVAAAVRDHGHPCSEPVSAMRDESAGRPDESAWILSCSEATYRVRFVGSERHTLIVRLR